MTAILNQFCWKRRDSESVRAEQSTAWHAMGANNFPTGKFDQLNIAALKSRHHEP